MGIENPRIAVAGLNPHSGEHGLFGQEEIQEIIPAIEAARAEGIQADGPVPPDTVFSKARGGWYDIVVAMYHDQGHIPLKVVGFVYDQAKQAWDAVARALRPPKHCADRLPARHAGTACKGIPGKGG